MKLIIPDSPLIMILHFFKLCNTGESFMNIADSIGTHQIYSTNSHDNPPIPQTEVSFYYIFFINRIRLNCGPQHLICDYRETSLFNLVLQTLLNLLSQEEYSIGNIIFNSFIRLCERFIGASKYNPGTINIFARTLFSLGSLKSWYRLGSLKSWFSLGSVKSWFSLGSVKSWILVP